MRPTVAALLVALGAACGSGGSSPGSHAPVHGEHVPKPCDVAECGPRLGMPTAACSDGSTAGPTGLCIRDPNGNCGWEIHECPVTGAGCIRAGCSGERCVEEGADEFASICEWSLELVCYKSAACEHQADGACGWTATDALAACLASPPVPESPDL